jgi:hypothetical protein
MVWSFVYVAFRRILGLLVLRGRCERSKDRVAVVMTIRRPE